MNTPCKRQFLYKRMIDHNLTKAEAKLYLQFNDKCNYETIVREWRKVSEDDEDGLQRTQEFRTKYSSLEHYKACLAKAERTRQEEELNLSLFY